MAICRELQSSKVSNVMADIELTDKSKPPQPIYWDKTLPDTAVLVRVGLRVRPLIEKKRVELNGLEWLEKLQQDSERANENLAKAFGRKGPCEPGVI
jgi:hypothetical protein